MITGIGIDIVKNNEIRDIIEKYGNKFIKKIYTAPEIDYCINKPDYIQLFAVRFAIKEATFKALSTGWNNGVNWKNVELYFDEFETPHIHLFNKAYKIYQELGIKNIHVSFSQTKVHSVAIAIIVN